MSSECASSPRAGGGGLCKAFKEMKSKVATHTGMSLSFVELVATSPVVGFLPALPPSPRSPSALLHRRMNLHSNYTFVTRRSSSTDQSTCVEMDNMDRQSLYNVELELAQCSFGMSAVDGDTRLGIKLSPMPCDVSHGCRVRDMSSESPSSCNLASGHPLSSPCVCSLTCGHQSSTSSSCNLLCGQPTSSSSCVLESVSSSTCNSPCGYPSSSSSCDLFCGHSSSSSSSSSSGDFSYGHQLASSASLPCDLSSGHSSSSSDWSAKLVFDMRTSLAEKLSSNNVECCNTFCTSYPSICKQAAAISLLQSQIPSISARVLYFIVTLIFGLSSISKSFYKFCLWVSRCVLHPDTLLHYIRVMISAGSIKTKSDKLSGVEDGGCGHEMEDLKVDVSVSLHSSKTSCMKRSKLLKSKLRSSFKSLSVQVPRKAFAPVHFNTFPHSSSSSSLSSTTSSPSSAVNNSPTVRKARALKSPTFARKLSKSFNQRQPVAIPQLSPVPAESGMQGSPTSHMVWSHPSSCGFMQHSHNRATSLNKLGKSIVVPLVAIPLALCALFYGKFVAFVAVTAWLVVVSIASSVCFLWRTFFQICSQR